MDPVQQALEMARARAEAQRQLEETLRRTLVTPMVEERIHVSLVALRHEKDGPVLAIALPTGKRIDIEVTNQSVNALFETLGKLPANDEADKPEGDAPRAE